MNQEARTSDKFSGSIDRIRVSDIVQLACLADLSADINIKSVRGTGIVSVRSGQAVYCRMGEIFGENALREILLWPEGSFTYAPEDADISHNISKTWEQLLIEIFRQRYEHETTLATGSESGFSGAVAKIDLPDLIQLACMAETGRVLRIEAGPFSGTMFFKDGRVAHALCGEFAGENAFREIMLADSGIFESLPLDGSEPVTIDQPIEELITRAMLYRRQVAEAPESGEELSLIQKIQRMKMAEKIRLALTGNKETRSLLLREGNRMVQLAVLANPRLSDPEVVLMAGSKQVDEEVLRRIANNREWLRLYQVRVALVKNPKCPPAISTKLIQSLGPLEWKSILSSKSVPSIVAQMARRLLSK